MSAVTTFTSATTELKGEDEKERIEREVIFFFFFTTSTIVDQTGHDPAVGRRVETSGTIKAVSVCVQRKRY